MPQWFKLPRHIKAIIIIIIIIIIIKAIKLLLKLNDIDLDRIWSSLS